VKPLPNELRITDLRVAVVGRAPMTCPLIRIDTNQGIYGLGEVRDGASERYALMLKSRLLGEDPRNVDRLFRKIKQFGHHGRQGGGVCAVEMALWDIAGKYYGVPAWQLLGGKFRDKIRIYADTTMSPNPKETARHLKERMERGFTFLKMDIGISLLDKLDGTISRPTGLTLRETFQTQHMFTGVELTKKGIDALADYAMTVRESVGWNIPLALDHFGHIGVKSCIRLGQALEDFAPAWLEDMIPWQHADLWRRITEAVPAPTCTGEDIYLKEDFIRLCQSHAVDVIHPDLMTSGGILETKKIGDAAQDYGIPMAMHFAGTPVACMANVHCAAATENFYALENHSADVPWWDDLVSGIEKPIIDGGFIRVPDAPGLGIELKEETVRAHLAKPGYFEPTPEWDEERSWDRLWS
jgi:L-alanine-DL-glutamate epimerase-like enolase superfamily enzyme